MPDHITWMIRDTSLWDRVRQVRIENRPATRFELRVRKEHLGTFLVMGGHLQQHDFGKTLVVDVYHDNGNIIDALT